MHFTPRDEVYAAFGKPTFEEVILEKYVSTEHDEPEQEGVNVLLGRNFLSTKTFRDRILNKGDRICALRNS